MFPHGALHPQPLPCSPPPHCCPCPWSLDMFFERCFPLFPTVPLPRVRVSKAHSSLSAWLAAERLVLLPDDWATGRLSSRRPSRMVWGPAFLGDGSPSLSLGGGPGCRWERRARVQITGRFPSVPVPISGLCSPLLCSSVLGDPDLQPLVQVPQNRSLGLFPGAGGWGAQLTVRPDQALKLRVQTFNNLLFTVPA